MKVTLEVTLEEMSALVASIQARVQEETGTTWAEACEAAAKGILMGIEASIQKQMGSN